MKIDTQHLEDQQARLTVEVEVEVMEEFKRRAARKLSGRVKIPGFRPGKAPYPVVLRQLGDGAITEEALELLVDDIYPKVIKEANIKPYGPGRLDNVVKLDPPVLEFVIPLEAEVNLGDYSSIRKDYSPKKITEKEVKMIVENLRERQAILEPVERPAQEGDQVTIHLSAIRKQAEEEKDSTLIREREYPIVIQPIKKPKKGDAQEWPFPGFSCQLMDLSANDEKILKYRYPEDAEVVSFRGVEAEFSVHVDNVKSRTLPDLDDDFARSLGEYADLKALRVEVRSGLESQAKQEYDTEYDEAILDQAVKGAIFKYPPQMYENEVEEVIENLKERLERQKLSMDLYLKTRNLDMDGLRKDVRPVAETRLKRNLFLSHLSKAENIQVPPEELQAEAENTVNYLANNLPDQEARRLSRRDVYSNVVGNVLVEMIIRRTRDRLRDICSGKVDTDTTTAVQSTQATASPTIEATPSNQTAKKPRKKKTQTS